MEDQQGKQGRPRRDQHRPLPFDVVADGTLSIIGRSFRTTVRSNTHNTLIATDARRETPSDQRVDSAA
jgi:hypothetical protein